MGKKNGKKVKHKTHKASKARFKKTASGKIRLFAPNKRHILAKKPSKRKRRLRKAGFLKNNKSVNKIKKRIAV